MSKEAIDYFALQTKLFVSELISVKMREHFVNADDSVNVLFSSNVDNL